MFADVLNDCVMLVELAAPLLPRPLVLPVLCGAGVGRSLVGVAGGATKAAVAQHQVKGMLFSPILSLYKPVISRRGGATWLTWLPRTGARRRW